MKIGVINDTHNWYQDEPSGTRKCSYAVQWLDEVLNQPEMQNLDQLLFLGDIVHDYNDSSDGTTYFAQIKNKAKAMKVLRSRLLEMQRREQEKKISEERRSMIGTGDRSERIRTYNFPQGRVTDHRIGLTLYKLNDILEGELDMIIDPLITYFQAEALEKQKIELE